MSDRVLVAIPTTLIARQCELPVPFGIDLGHLFGRIAMSEPNGDRRLRVNRRDFLLAWVLYAVFVLVLVSASLADVGGASSKVLGPKMPLTAGETAGARAAP